MVQQAGTLGLKPGFIAANQVSAVKNNCTAQPGSTDMSAEAFERKVGAGFAAQSGDKNRMPVNAQGSFINVAGSDRAGVENVAPGKGGRSPTENLVQHRDHVTDGNVNPWRKDAQSQADGSTLQCIQQMG